MRRQAPVSMSKQSSRTSPPASFRRRDWGRSRLRERRSRHGRTDANARLPRPRLRPRPQVRRSNGVRPCPGHPLDHSMSDSAGRSPGSRVDARYAPSQAVWPSGCPTRPSNVHISLSAYSCRDSRGVGRPSRPHRIPQLSLFRGTGAIIRTAALAVIRSRAVAQSTAAANRISREVATGISAGIGCVVGPTTSRTARVLRHPWADGE